MMIPQMTVALAIALTTASLAPGNSQAADPGQFETGGSMTLRLEYASRSVCELTLAVDVWKSSAGQKSVALSCDGREAVRPLTAQEAKDFLRLAKDAQLYRARGIGRDNRAADAWLATLKVTERALIVILVVSGNPEFDRGPLRELMQFIDKLFTELRPRLATVHRR